MKIKEKNVFFLGKDPDILADAARVILQKIDPKKHKKEYPTPPIISEFFGLHKAGKDTQLTELDRWFKRQKFNVVIRQESAEAEPIRATPRQNPYAYEMRHFAYTFSNLLDASSSRDFHLVILNRGIIDTLCWLERLKRKGEITETQNTAAKEFILSGPWLLCVDAFFYLTCDVEEALRREYGNSSKVIYGSRMNPKEMEFMNDCFESIYKEIKERFPNLPIFKINTTKRTISNARDEILYLLLQSVISRLALRENDLLLWSRSLMREKARMAGPELKFRGVVSYEVLREQGWHWSTSCDEKDEYITPKNASFLENNECFHLRKTGDRWYFVYKRQGEDTKHWSKIHVPLLKDSAEEERERILGVFDSVVTISKERETFYRDNFLLHRDKVQDLGEFIEIKATMPIGENVLLNLAKELGFKETDLIVDSYVKLKRKLEK